MADTRLENLKSWLKAGAGLTNFEIEVASADASFRRYFRVITPQGTFIAMDAPPDKEDCQPYLKIATAFFDIGLNVPKIFAKDLGQGYLLLSDLGKTQYAAKLNRDTVDQLYADALDALCVLQTTNKPASVELPPYDHALLKREMGLFDEWFVGKHLGINLTKPEMTLLANLKEQLAQAALEQPSVWVHRDYHSRNLMVTEQHNPGVLDFQDAVFGAVTYDLVSLLRDCYVAWPTEKVYQWVEAYRRKLLANSTLPVSDSDQFKRWFDLMGVQRHMKAIGIFARLNYRDGKPGYLPDIPRTLNYVMEVSKQYKDYKPFYELIQERILPKFNMQTGAAK